MYIYILYFVENLSYESEKEKNSSMLSFPPLIRPFRAVLEGNFSNVYLF